MRAIVPVLLFAAMELAAPHEAEANPGIFAAEAAAVAEEELEAPDVPAPSAGTEAAPTPPAPPEAEEEPEDEPLGVAVPHNAVGFWLDVLEALAVGDFERANDLILIGRELGLVTDRQWEWYELIASRLSA